MGDPDQFSVAPQDRINDRRRIVQLIINIVEPDPDLQPLLLTDEASLFEVSQVSPGRMQRLLESYFGCAVPIDLRQPIWKVDDALKELFPGWPDGWSPQG